MRSSTNGMACARAHLGCGVVLAASSALCGCGGGLSYPVPSELQPGPGNARPVQLGGIRPVEGALLLDESFGDGGLEMPADLRPASLAYDRFARLMLGARDGTPPSAVVERRALGGELDRAFGEAGRVRLADALPGGPAGPPGGLPTVRALIVDASDRIVLASSTVVAGEGTTTGARALVARLETDGDLDPGFGESGRVQLPPTRTQLSTTAVDVVSDGVGGLLVLALQLEPRENPLDEPTPRVFVARLDAQGALDPGYGVGGYAFVADGEPSSASALVRDEHGRALVAGERRGPRTRLALWRFTLDGAPDALFGDAGEAQLSGAEEALPVDLSAVDLVLAPDGGIVVAGRRFSDSRVLTDWPNIVLDYSSGMPIECAGALWRFTADGELDPAFGVGGSTRLAFNAGPYVSSSGGDHLDLCAALAIDDAGRLLVAQLTEPPRWEDQVGALTFDPPHLALLRVLPDGRLDERLGGAGGVVLGASLLPPTWPDALGRPVALALDGHGRACVAGSSPNQAGLLWCLVP